MEESGVRKIVKKLEVRDESILELRSDLQEKMKIEQNQIKEVDQLRLWIYVWGV